MHKWLVNTLLAVTAVTSAGSLSAGDYGKHPLALAFIDKMSTEHNFDRNEVAAIIGAAERKQSIIDAMNRPAEKVKPWKDYRDIFIQEKRIDLGVQFWREHKPVLDKVSKSYGVDPAIIVAIIGVETYYGRNTGSYRVIDALSTLAFDYPKRSTFFTSELENFFLLAREQGQDPLSLKGSYAGAMGYGQFIPSSYRHYSADYNGDGFNDIWDNPQDAIASVANYFKEHGWKTGEPVATRATARDGYDSELLNKLKKPYVTLVQHRKEGIQPEETYPQTMVALPMKLEGAKGTEYWLGFSNFYTVTRYNHSHRYAMAVFQLSELIRDRIGQ